MADNPTNPTWIEPPPRKQGMGCVGKGCLVTAIGVVILGLLFVFGSYFFVTHVVVSKKPAAIPVKPISDQELNDVQQRIDNFKSAPAVPSFTPAPATTTTSPAPGQSATPSPEPSPAGRQLTLSAAEINGLIAANNKSRGHAFVSMSGNTATVELSIPANKVGGLPSGYLNGSFVITTNGPTPISALHVSRIQANGYNMPSSILTTSIGGRSAMSYALEEASRYNVTTAEIRDGILILR
jgi:hypothetical protein